MVAGWSKAPSLPEGQRAVRGEAYQQAAHRACATTILLIDRLTRQQPTNPGGSLDAGPVISGVVGGALQFMASVDQSDEQIRASINSLIDELLPQIRMADASTPGHDQGGNA